MTNVELTGKGIKCNFQNVSIEENICEPGVIKVTCLCKKGQKWLQKYKPVGIMIIYNGEQI